MYEDNIHTLGMVSIATAVERTKRVLFFQFIKFHIQHAKAPADYIKLYPTSGTWSISDTLLRLYFGAVCCNVVTCDAHMKYNHTEIAYY